MQPPVLVGQQPSAHRLQKMDEQVSLLESEAGSEFRPSRAETASRRMTLRIAWLL
jgi:hypothetical protein